MAVQKVKSQKASKAKKSLPKGKKRSVEGRISMATLKDYRVSPRKARLVVNQIRGKNVNQALDVLGNCDRKTAPVVKKLLMSAVANASSNSRVDVDELVVKRIWVSEGKRLYRMMPRAQGRATPIRKRFSTITLHLDEVGA